MSEAEGSGLYDTEYSDSDDESETCLSEESDSDSSDGSDTEEEGDEEFVTEEPRVVDVQAASGISSDEGGEKESCPICLNRFIGQDLGIPKSCDHIFCLECIKEWSKNINTCPIDRTEFNYVHLKSTPNGKVLKKIKVKVRPKEPEDALPQEVTVCEVCRHGDREDRLLLCDACDLAYHCECLDPPLFHVPIEEWFCPPCSTVLQNEAIAGPSTSRSRRVIPRTRASENVRTRVQDRRTRPVASRSPSTVRKRAPQKRKRRAYRRSYKKVVTLARTKKNLMDGSKGKECPRSTAVIVTYRRRKRRRKRRTKKTTKATSNRKKMLHAATNHISKQLNLIKPSRGGSIPDVKPQSKSSSKSIRSSGSSNFLFGDKNQLMDFNESYLEDAPGPSSRQQAEISQQSSSSSINILDSIIAGQTILHTKSNDVIIKKDGSLVLKDKKTKDKGMAKKPTVWERPKETETVKKPTVLDKTKEREMIKKPNVSDRMIETGAIKKSSDYDKTKDKGKSIITNPGASNKMKSHVTFREKLSEFEAIPKTEKSSERKPSPMLLAALARRSENEKFDQSRETSFEKSRKENCSKNNFQNSRDFNFNLEHDSFAYSGLNVSALKYETDDKTSLLKCEKGDKSPKHFNHSSKPKFNNVSEFHGIARNTSSKDNTLEKQFCDKNENISSNSCVKKFNIQRHIKKEKRNDLISAQSNEEISGTNTAIETEINYEDDNTMELLSSQSLIQSNSCGLLTPFNGVKQEILNMRKESDSFTENSNSECSQSLVEPVNKQIIRKSQCHKSTGNKVNSFKKKIKKLLESSDDDCSPKTNHSFIESSQHVLDNEDDTLDFEESQSIISQTFTETITKNSHINRKRLKKEIISSDDETNVPHGLKAYSQSKPLDKLRKNNISEDFPKIKIKEEHHSSEDEAGESSSLLTGLSFTELVEKSNSLYSNPMQGRNSNFNGRSSDLPCDKNSKLSFRNSPNYPFNNPEEDLPCTQLANFTGEQEEGLPSTQCMNPKSVKSHFNKDKLLSTQPDNLLSNMEMEDLPCTQLLKSTLVRPLSNEDDVLPNTQLNRKNSSMELENLPCTQLVVPAPISQLKKSDHKLAATKPSCPFSEMEVDDFPCTQLAETSFDEELDVLPCTQVTRPISDGKNKNLLFSQSSSPVSNKETDDLPCTNYAPSTSLKLHSKEKEDALPSTQPCNSFFEMQRDDLSCTQLVEPSSKSVVNEEDSLPCTQIAGHVPHMEMDDLPCTLLARPRSSKHIPPLLSKQFVVPTPTKNHFKKEDELPGTQPSSPRSNIERNDLPCTQFAIPNPKNSLSKEKENASPATQPCSSFSDRQMDDLPCTQLVEPSSKSVFDEEDSLPCTQIAGHVPHMEMDDLPCTQSARPLSSKHIPPLISKQFVAPTPTKNHFKKEEELPGTQPSSPFSDIEMDDLPCTQFAIPTPENSLSKEKENALPATQPCSSFSEMQINDLPCTQLVKPSSKSVSNKEKDALSCTQLANPVSCREFEDLPCTQTARPLSSLQMEDIPPTQCVVPSSAKPPSKKREDALASMQQSSHLSNLEMDDLPSTQLVKPVSLANKGNDTLPPTQLSFPVSSEHSGESPSNHPNLNTHLHSKKLTVHNSNLSGDSNAQSMDKFCKATNDHKNLSTNHSNACAEKNTENSANLNNLNSNLDDDFDLPETQPLIFDQNHSISNKSVQESSNNEHITEKKFLYNVDKLKIKRPSPKKIVGVHKNLPQVLMPIPSRQVPVPKPSNRKTFSFDQVKQQCNIKDNKNKLHENISHRRKLDVEKDKDRSSKLISPIRKKEQPMSFKCADIIKNDINDEKSTVPSFVDESQISTFSVQDCDIKGEMHENSMPADSEIEIINDNEIIKLKQVEEVLLSSDEEDLPATQFVGRQSNQFSAVPTQEKLENLLVSVKRENDSLEILPETQKCDSREKSTDSVNLNGNGLKKINIKKENQDIQVKITDSLCVKQEKYEKSVLNKIKIEPLQQQKTEKEDSRSIKGKTVSHNFKNISDVRKVQSANKCLNQKASHTKEICNNVESRYVRGHDKNAKESKIKTEITDHDEKTMSVPSNSSAEFEKSKKNKSYESKINSNVVNKAKIKAEARFPSETSTNSNRKVNYEHVNQSKNISETGIHSNTEIEMKTKSENRSKSKNSNNSKMKVNTESAHKLKLLSKDKKPKTGIVSSSNSHTETEHIETHERSLEKHKSSSKEDNYHEDSKRRKTYILNGSEKKQNHKVDTTTIRNESIASKNNKHAFDITKETHSLKNIKIEDSSQQTSSKPIAKIVKVSNSEKIRKTSVSNKEESRNDNKSTKAHSKSIEKNNSNKSSSDVDSKAPQSRSNDRKKSCKNGNSENKCGDLRNIPFNNKEKLNGKIKSESDSDNKTRNQLKECKTNFRDVSKRTESVLKRSESFHDKTNTKRPRLDSLSCNEDTSDCYSDYSRSSEISSESNIRKKRHHQRNALNTLNEIADEIISASKDCKTGILNQDEKMDLDVTKRSKNHSPVGRKVDKAHLKEEIAAEVKTALKPFYTIGLIDKEDYKDIMRKAVPKIFTNCGNIINPEKIKNLVTSYVKRLTNS